ncbi:hypothetical protein [Micromonospora sp. NPDC023633]|uniref:hypothetical protein n=1 Tax=Micromonospora sp. NPDC023633 TaxID=3154320 RepID=UPI0033F28096
MFGFNREGFSDKARQQGLDRRERIVKAVRTLAIWIRIHRAELAALRDAVKPTVPDPRPARPSVDRHCLVDIAGRQADIPAARPW